MAVPAADRPPTIRTVAARAGVSKSLVSLVLQSSPHVSDAKRQAVLKAVAELGYRPDPVARSLAERRTRTVGVVIDDLSNPWYVALLDGLRPVLHERGLRPLLADGRTEPDAVRALADLRVDGLVLVGTVSSTAADQVEALGHQIPTVVAGTREPRLTAVDLVANDDFQGGQLATRHLLELGHRRIAAIGGTPGWYANDERMIGFRAALAAEGLLPDPALVRQSDWRIPRGEQAAEELLSLPDPPTAIFGFNDNVAIGALNAARNVGLRVPDDLSLIGFDDTELATIVRPRLTTVRQPLAELGRTGVSLLLRLIEGQRLDALRMELSTTLVVRETTAAPPPERRDA
jgi:DNA-binding LacI/PurR family transcriptional regulator